jgi:hypothetical protein
MAGRTRSDEHDEWDRQARHETREERLDRNWAELVQELRVVQIGVQFLFAALLSIPFQQRFKDLTSFQRDAYACTLVLTVVAAILLMAPPSFHRIVFRQQVKGDLVDAAQRLMLAGLAVLAVAMTSALVLVLDVVTGRSGLFWAVILAAVAGFVAFWYAWPLSVRARAGTNHPSPEDPD